MSHRTRKFVNVANDPTLDIIEGSRTSLLNHEKEGVSSTLSSNVEKVVWNEDAIFSYPENSNIAVQIVSTSALDTSAGTGARTISISGLQFVVVGGVNTYVEKSEIVTMTGTTAKNCANQYYRVLKLDVATAGSTGLNQGNIKVHSNGSAGVIHNCMEATMNTSNSLIVSPETNFNILVEKIHVNSYFQTNAELKVNIHQETTGLQKTIYKFFLNSNSGNFTFNIKKKIRAGETMWVSINPLESVGTHQNKISCLLESVKKHENSIVPLFAS